MKRRTILMTIALILTILILAGCGQQPEEQEEEVEEIAVETAKASVGVIEITDTITGLTAPSLEVNVVPKTGGKVERVAVKVGDRVKAGDLLVQLDTTEIAAQVRQAEAALRAVEGNIAVAELNYNSAKDNLERMEYLYQQGGISEQQYEAAKNQLEVAKAQLDNVKSGSVEQAQAALDLAKTQLNNAVITAPASGFVASVNVEPGEMAGPTAPVVTIIDLDTVLAEFNLTEGQVGLVKKGMEMEVAVPAGGDKKFKGTVKELALMADPRTKAFPVKIAIENKDQAIKPGMTAEIQLTLDKSEQNLIVPVEAIMEYEGKTSLYIVENGVAVLKEVKVILENESHAAVEGDLPEGSEIVVAGKEQLADQAKVKVVNRRGE